MDVLAPRRDVENALTERTESLRQQGNALVRRPRSTSNTRAVSATAPAASASQARLATHTAGRRPQTRYGIKTQAKSDRSRRRIHPEALTPLLSVRHHAAPGFARRVSSTAGTMMARRWQAHQNVDVRSVAPA